MTSPPIGTDEELIERWNRTSDLEGNVSDICNAGDAIANALVSRISEVERLEGLVEDAFLSGYCSALHAEHVTELNEDDYHAAHIGSEGYRAALSQHRTTG